MKKVFGLTLVFLMADIIIKQLVISTMALNSKITVINSFFSIWYVKNSGAAFGMLENWRLLLILFALAVIYLIIKMLKKEKRFTIVNTLLYAMMLAGIIGNLIDRLIYHAVIDYLSFNLAGFQFAVFNLADFYIVSAIIIYLIFSLFQKEVFHYE